MQIFQRRVRMIASWLERHHRSGGPRGVDEIEGGAEETRQCIRERQPSLIGSVPISNFIEPKERTYSSSDSASTQAQSSTPVPPSLAPPHGLAPQLSASHLPKLNLKCSSLVFAYCNICPKLLGKYLKFCCSKACKLVLLWKLKDARRSDGCRGRSRSCSW